MKTEKLQRQNNIATEPFYNALKDDPKFLKEAFERMFDIVNTDSKAAKEIARLIKEDCLSLYEEVVALSKPEKGQSNSPSCCGGN